MNRAAEKALASLRADGHQRKLIGRMQTREELYEVLGYHAYERKLDELFGRSGDEDIGGEGVGAGKAGRPDGERKTVKSDPTGAGGRAGKGSGGRRGQRSRRKG
jgi:hypothetical protein